MKKYEYKTSSGVSLPLEVGVYRVNQETLLSTLFDPINRDSWCQAGPKVCSQFGCRPCCPPKFPTFDNLRTRKNMYVVIVRMNTQDYLDAYPNVAQKMAYYGATTGVHYQTRGKLYAIIKNLYQPGDQGFKVGGCSGCTVKKTGKCNKILMPALEGTGINVVGLYKHLTGDTMEWNKDGKLMGTMAAVGGLLTDRDLSKSDILKVVEEVLK